MPKYIVAYAKIVVDKDDGISLAGVYFGGIGDTYQDAESIARECVNTVRGGTILPKVVKLEVNNQLTDALYDATEKFERITANMTEANNAINKKKKK